MFRTEILNLSVIPVKNELPSVGSWQDLWLAPHALCRPGGAGSESAEAAARRVWWSGASAGLAGVCCCRPPGRRRLRAELRSPCGHLRDGGAGVCGSYPVQRQPFQLRKLAGCPSPAFQASGLRSAASLGCAQEPGLTRLPARPFSQRSEGPELAGPPTRASPWCPCALSHAHCPAPACPAHLDVSLQPFLGVRVRVGCVPSRTEVLSQRRSTWPTPFMAFPIFSSWAHRTAQ